MVVGITLNHSKYVVDTSQIIISYIQRSIGIIHAPTNHLAIMHKDAANGRLSLNECEFGLFAM